jgi:hypothetical protein
MIAPGAELLPGALGLALAGLAATLLALRNNRFAVVILVGFGLRACLATLDAMTPWTIPGGEVDAVEFEARARRWSQLSWRDLWTSFDLSSSYVFSWVSALVFKVLGESALLMRSLNVMAGVLTIYLCGKIGEVVENPKAGLWAAWVVALFPFTVFASASALREAFPVAFFTAGILQAVLWSRTGSNRRAFLALGAFGGATLFHGGFIAAFLAFMAVLLWKVATEAIKSARRRGFSTRVVARLGAAGLGGILVVGVISGGLQVSKLSPFIQEGGESGLISAIDGRLTFQLRGETAYPEMIAMGDPIREPWVGPLRIAYFLWSPFPWDFRQTRHLAGVASGGLFALLILIAIVHRKRIRKVQGVGVGWLISGATILVFAIGTANIGTAVRHRAKFLPVVTVLALSGVRSRSTQERAASANAPDYAGGKGWSINPAWEPPPHSKIALPARPGDSWH